MDNRTLLWPALALFIGLTLLALRRQRQAEACCDAGRSGRREGFGK